MTEPTKTIQTEHTHWLTRWTTLADIMHALTDEPLNGWRAWACTTAGLVALLIVLQLFTGLLLACYYVPALDSAHTTVAYIEQVSSGGSWLRALHVYSSVLLPVALILHLIQKLWRGSHLHRPAGWLSSVMLLALVLAAAGTGYTLPGDARAFYSTRVAEGLVGGLPLVGPTARLWLLGGPSISTLTISRLFALHALLLPFLLLTTINARLFIFRERRRQPDAPHNSHDTPQAQHAKSQPSRLRAQLARNAVVAGLAFAALALYAMRYPAPFGPRADAVPPEYLPRPGAQFLWLFEFLKHTSGASAAFVGLLLPALLLILLALVPFIAKSANTSSWPRRHAGALIIGLLCALVLGPTALALINDARDPRVRDQLARQSTAEANSRRAPFRPQRARTADAAAPQTTDATHTQPPGPTNTQTPPPAAYTQHCAKCHGAHGEGVRPHPKLIGVATLPNRTVTDLIAILNDPAAYGLQKPMPSFATKLTDDDKRHIAQWLEELK